MASNVPKFASFRPKPRDIDKPANSDRTSNPERPGSVRREIRDIARPSTAKHKTSSKSRDHPLRDKERLPYFIDRKGDVANLTYGTLNSYDTPSYRRHGYGSILGLPRYQRIDREHSTDKAIYTTGSRSERRERLLASKGAVKVDDRKLRVILPISNPYDNVQADFVPLSAAGRKRKRGTSAQLEDFRTVEVGEQSEIMDSDLEADSDSGTNDSTTEVTERNSILIRHTRERPQDLQAWLELVNHQEAMLTLGRSDFRLDDADRRNLAEIKVALYEQAIRKVENVERHQIQLHIGLLTEARIVWNDEKLRGKWVEILRRYRYESELWIGYLNFIQSQFSAFKYETCRQSYQECLKDLGSQEQNDQTDSSVCHVLVRLTCMLRDAGYQEHSLAIWQAVLEFVLLRPGDHTKAESLAAFEDFWDSEVPRIGEANAKGWRHSDTRHPDEYIDNPVLLSAPAHPRSFMEAFGAQELDRMNKLRSPGRTTDDIGDDDPFHLVLFSDLELVRLLPDNLSPRLVVDAFVCFAGAPPLPYVPNTQNPWWADSFMSASQKCQNRHCLDSGTMKSVFRRHMHFSEHVQFTIEYLFDYAFANRTIALEAPFFRRVLKLLAMSSSVDKELVGSYLLAMEAEFFPEEAHKTAKQLLRSSPMSLKLYHAYGMVELRRGNPSKADQVFSAALSMQKDASPLAMDGSLKLFHAWVWEALEKANMTQALSRLVRPLGKAVPSSMEASNVPDSTSYLRARALFTESKERALLGHDYVSAVYHASLQAILAYLLDSNHEPKSALCILEDLSLWFLNHGASRSPAAELHAQFLARFLLLHATTAPIVKPALIRNVLKPALETFPDNTILLSLFAANEARFAINDRVRDVMHKNNIGGNNSSIASWFFAVNYEVSRGEIAGSTNHTTRALLQRAEESVGKHCPALWKWHVEFELAELRKETQLRGHSSDLGKKASRGRKDKFETRLEEARRRVRETFFKGLMCLPWCKEYMMLAFTHLMDESVLGEDELKKVVGVMMEKELRVYTDVDGL